MENDPIISTFILREKLKAIDGAIADLSKQKSHIEWVLSNFTNKKTPGANITNQPMHSMSRKDTVVSILGKNGQPMRAVEIFREMSKYGHSIKRNVFDALLSEMNSKSDGPIKRIDTGIYALNAF